MKRLPNLQNMRIMSESMVGQQAAQVAKCGENTPFSAGDDHVLAAERSA
jgi:hypothetical protein